MEIDKCPPKYEKDSDYDYSEISHTDQEQCDQLDKDFSCGVLDLNEIPAYVRCSSSHVRYFSIVNQVH